MLDLAQTYVRILPIEICLLKQLYDLNLSGCPLEPVLAGVYQKGIVALLKHYAEKLQRENYREKIVNAAREDIWVDTPVAHIQEAIGKVLDSLESEDISLVQRLLRNLKYVLPSTIADVDPFMIRMTLATSKVKSGGGIDQTSGLNNSMSKSFNIRGKGPYPADMQRGQDSVRNTVSVEGSHVHPIDVTGTNINIQSHVVEDGDLIREEKGKAEVISVVDAKPANEKALKAAAEKKPAKTALKTTKKGN